MKMLLALAAIALVVLVLGAYQFGRLQAGSNLAIVVRPGPSSVQLDCVRGCNWTRLAFGCPGNEACNAEVGRKGLGPIAIDASALGNR